MLTWNSKFHSLTCWLSRRSITYWVGACGQARSILKSTNTSNILETYIYYMCSYCTTWRWCILPHAWVIFCSKCLISLPWHNAYGVRMNRTYQNLAVPIVCQQSQLEPRQAQASMYIYVQQSIYSLYISLVIKYGNGKGGSMATIFGWYFPMKTSGRCRSPHQIRNREPQFTTNEWCEERKPLKLLA